MKKTLFALLYVLPLTAVDLIIKQGNCLFVPNKLGNLELIRNDEGYEIIKNNVRHRVKNYDIDPFLKRLDQNKLATFLGTNAGYIEISQLDNDDYKLKTKIRGDGGFLLTGVIVYNTLKYTGYAAYGIGSIGAIGAGFVTGGPAGACGAYAGALAALPTVAAGIESGALIVGTAASWVPGLP